MKIWNIISVFDYDMIKRNWNDKLIEIYLIDNCIINLFPEERQIITNIAVMLIISVIIVRMRNV